MPQTEQLHSPPALAAIGNNWHSRTLIRGMTVVALPAFSDNYLWLLHDDTSAWVFDPGTAEPIIDYLSAHRLTLKGILITHSHWDHVSGIQALVKHCPAPVYGPPNIHPGIDHSVAQGDTIIAGPLTFQVQATPGHMAEHLSYYEANEGLLFCGDTLFSAGCGRLKQTGDMRALFTSLEWIKALPASTVIFCSHEYTLANLAFAHAAEPDNQYINDYRAAVEQRRADNQPSLPTQLGTELCINPFLRLPGLTATDQDSDARFARFQTLRQWKDRF